ncbi:MAG: ATP phosphoribosyltransferase regulatory subunit [Eubacterium sp.]|nr:ATP phosphoribosyltransferase regulatory subunit [Eubacterium sp.]
MKDRLLHTPEGVRDIYGNEFEKKLILEERLHTIIRMYGYKPIQTPSFEFFDVFGTEIGTTPSKDLYKFFDREGNTLVLRPDITPSIARAAAKYFMEETRPLRFSYVGNTFINNSSYQGRLKETTQIGAEFINDNSVDADAEMIAITCECFLKAGLTDFQISVGHVGFLRAVCEMGNISKADGEVIRDLISIKNYFGAEEYVTSLNVSEETIAVFKSLPQFNGGTEMLKKAREFVTNNDKAVKAIERLEALYNVLSYYGCEKYVTFDLSYLSPYDYYSGIIFDGYTFGSGEPIAKGGRYDDLVGYFGKNAPAVGFVIMIDALMTAAARQKIDIPVNEKKVLLLYSDSSKKAAVERAKNLRDFGSYVEMMKIDKSISKEEYDNYANSHAISEIIAMED